MTATARQPATRTTTPKQAPSPRGHRAPRGSSVYDLIFKTRAPGDAGSGGRWTATLRNDPAVVIVADDGDTLTTLSQGLALAIFQGHGRETLLAMQQAGTALPEPEPPAASG